MTPGRILADVPEKTATRGSASRWRRTSPLMRTAAYAHSLGLSWGQKNGGGDAAFTAAEINTVHADWALIEECNRYGGCSTYTPYINLGKAVLNTEYTQDRMTTAKFCPADNMRNFDGILKSNALGATPRTACRAVN